MEEKSLREVKIDLRHEERENEAKVVQEAL